MKLETFLDHISNFTKITIIDWSPELKKTIVAPQNLGQLRFIEYRMIRHFDVLSARVEDNVLAIKVIERE